MAASDFARSSTVVAFDLCLQLARFPFEKVVKQLFGSVASVNFLDRLQEIEREGVAVRLEEPMTATGQPIDHLGPAHLLRASPGIEITVALEGEAMLLDPHVAHLHFGDELIDGESAGTLEGIENLKALGATDFGEQSLIQRELQVGIFAGRTGLYPRRGSNRKKISLPRPIFQSRCSPATGTGEQPLRSQATS